MLIDYSLYLVTDPEIIGKKDFFSAIEEALKGGVSLVQLREKNISSKDFYEKGMALKKLCHQYEVPLIINDRLDIALAIEADGLHIGQKDLPISVARALLGRDKLLGYSVSTVEQAVYGKQQGADYLGVGGIFPTTSKADASLIGVETARKIKEAVKLPMVGIGGIQSANIKQVKDAGLDGAAVISAILGKVDVQRSAKELHELWREQN